MVPFPPSTAGSRTDAHTAIHTVSSTPGTSDRTAGGDISARSADIRFPVSSGPRIKETAQHVVRELLDLILAGRTMIGSSLIVGVNKNISLLPPQASLLRQEGRQGRAESARGRPSSMTAYGGYGGVFGHGRKEAAVKSTVPKEEALLTDVNWAYSGFFRKHRGITKKHLNGYLAFSSEDGQSWTTISL